MQYGVPFVQEVYVGSPYLDHLNGTAGGEAPTRVGIANTASEYWRGGPFRLKDPDYAGELSILTSTAAAALDYWGFRVYADADADDWQAQSLAFRLWDAAFWLWNFDEFWCRATSDDRPIWSGHCLPNDGFVPTWSQFHPAATANFEVNGGPVHTQETTHFDEYIYAALTNFMHVPPRGGPSDPVPGPGPAPPPRPPRPDRPSNRGGSDSLSPDQSLYAGQSITSGDGRFYLIYQSDGNLVLYRNDAVPLWHTQTYGTSPGRAIMQLDGNLVVYDGSGTPIWASGTVGFGGAWLVMQSGRQSRHLLILWRAGLGQRHERLVIAWAALPSCFSRLWLTAMAATGPSGGAAVAVPRWRVAGEGRGVPAASGSTCLLSDEAARSDRRGCRDRHGSMEAEHRRTGRRNARFVAPRERKHRDGGRLCRLRLRRHFGRAEVAVRSGGRVRRGAVSG